MKNLKEIKRVIRQLVRESLLEVLSEQLVETTVRKVLSEQSRTPTPVRKTHTMKDAISMADQVLAESREKESTAPRQNTGPNREDMIRKIVGNNKEMAYILNDTAQSSNHILSENKEDVHDPDRSEQVSEDVLERMGLMKDYSRLIK